jgi:ABC-type antimicrobial peptide transport system permease subunit
MRRGLIVGQFAIAQVLIIGMIVIAGQLRFVHDSDPGFQKDDVVLVPMPDNKQVPAMKTLQARLLTIPGVRNVTTCFTAPAATDAWTTLFKFDNRTETEGFGINVRLGDDRYLATFDLKLLAGRNFFPSDTVRELLVNETFVKKLNIPDIGSVIGKKLALNSGDMPGTIVGVVKDFHDGSFHDDINAVCITTMAPNYLVYAVKMNMASLRTVLPMLQKAWKETYPNELYEQHFVDEDVAQFYVGEDRMFQLIQVFTLVAIFIGCLGLYGLVSFMVSQKTKEIGIRKVLGGSVKDILWIFGGEFSRLIFLALLVAAPIGWWLGSQWLMGFKFHISIGIGIFAYTVLISIGVALLAGGYQAVKASLMNPVRALRRE